MREQIEQINKFFEGAETVVVEAAHIYADKTPGQEQKIGAEIAAQISAGLAAKARKALLIDNLNIAHDTLDKDSYLTQLKAWGYEPDDIFMEKDMVEGVTGPGGLLERIKENRTAKIKNGQGLTKRIWTPDGMIGLVRSDGVPTCAALDSVFYLRKTSLGQGCITILPENSGDQSYRDQQKATQTIMARAGISIPIANIYFNQQTGERTLVLNK